FSFFSAVGIAIRLFECEWREAWLTSCCSASRGKAHRLNRAAATELSLSCSSPLIARHKLSQVDLSRRQDRQNVLPLMSLVISIMQTLTHDIPLISLLFSCWRLLRSAYSLSSS
ncbi:hypothetical protein CSUI_009038, partial [Cystoisospora suis]